MCIMIPFPSLPLRTKRGFTALNIQVIFDVLESFLGHPRRKICHSNPRGCLWLRSQKICVCQLDGIATELGPANNHHKKEIDQHQNNSVAPHQKNMATGREGPTTFCPLLAWDRRINTGRACCRLKIANHNLHPLESAGLSAAHNPPVEVRVTAKNTQHCTHAMYWCVKGSKKKHFLSMRIPCSQWSSESVQPTQEIWTESRRRPLGTAPCQSCPPSHVLSSTLVATGQSHTVAVASAQAGGGKGRGISRIPTSPSTRIQETCTSRELQQTETETTIGKSTRQQHNTSICQSVYV